MQKYDKIFLFLHFVRNNGFNVKQTEYTMKKIFLFFAAVVMTAGVMSAQDINQATEAYNNGAMELQMGNNAAALL